MTEAQKREIIPINWVNELRETFFISGFDGVIEKIKDWLIRLNAIDDKK